MLDAALCRASAAGPRFSAILSLACLPASDTFCLAVAAASVTLSFTFWAVSLSLSVKSSPVEIPALVGIITSPLSSHLLLSSAPHKEQPPFVDLRGRKLLLAGEPA